MASLCFIFSTPNILIKNKIFINAWQLKEFFIFKNVIIIYCVFVCRKCVISVTNLIINFKLIKINFDLLVQCLYLCLSVFTRKFCAFS